MGFPYFSTTYLGIIPNRREQVAMIYLEWFGVILAMHEFPVIKGTPLDIRYPPKKERMSPKKEEPFKRKGIVFQPLFF